MRTCDLRKEILRTFARGEHHGYEVHQLLRARGISVASTRLYKLLDDLRADGLLEGHWTRSDLGPKKHVYSLTSNGVAERMQILRDAINTVHEFYLEYIRNLPNRLSLVQALKEAIVSDFPEDGIIVGLMAMYNSAFDTILQSVTEEMPDCSAYVLDLSGSDHNLATDWSMLHGKCNDIPLKTHSANYLLVAGFQKEFADESTLREWKRILKSDGKIMLITPSSVCKPLVHPLPIGDFIEFYVHNDFSGPLVGEWESFLKNLEVSDVTVELESSNDLFILRGSLSHDISGVQTARVQIEP